MMQSTIKTPKARTERITSLLLGDDNQTSNYLSLKNSAFENNNNEVEVPSNTKINWVDIKDHLSSIVLTDIDIETDENDDSEDTSSINVNTNLNNVQVCTLVLCMYLFVGVISFSFIFETWSVSDAAYFTVVTLTTVGYGDFVPSSDASKIFLCLFGLSGVALIGIALGEIAAYAIDIAQQEFDRKVKLRKFRIVGGEDNNDDFAIDRELRMFWYYFFKIILMRFLPMQVVLSVIAHYFVLDRGSHYLEVFYYLIVTSLSIGYGDIFPSTPRHRIFASILILLSVGSMGDLVWNVVTLVIRHRKLRKVQRLESLEQFLKNAK